MPNHCINELIFIADEMGQDAIRAALCNSDNKVDFRVLVPEPANMWNGSVSIQHEKAFGRTGLNWAKENWGTKWNAYDSREIEATDDMIVFRFETAGRPPYPWLAAVFNTLKVSFEHNWLCEGGSCARHGVFNWPAFEGNGCSVESWIETPIESEDDPLYRQLHKLLWGVEEFSEADE